MRITYYTKIESLSRIILSWFPAYIVSLLLTFTMFQLELDIKYKKILCCQKLSLIMRPLRF